MGCRVIRAFLALFFLIFSIGSVGAQSVCMKKASCAGGEFFSEAWWVGLERVENSTGLIESGELGGGRIQKALLRSEYTSCYIEAILDLQTRIFKSDDDKKTINKKQFEKELNLIAADEQYVSKLSQSEMCRGVSNKDGRGFYKEFLYKIRPMSDFDDVLVNGEKYLSRSVRLVGVGRFTSNKFLIGKSINDTNHILLNFSALPDEEKLKISKSCSDLVRGCPVVVWGNMIRNSEVLQLKLSIVEFK